MVAGNSVRRWKRARMALGAVFVSLALAASACASSDSGSASKADGPSQDSLTSGRVNEQSAGGDVQRGGTVTFGVQALAPLLDPAATGADYGGTGGDAAAAVYGVLVRYDPQSGQYEPQLAQSLTSDDDVTWTLTLRDGVRFSDGTPLDANAVVASINRYNAEHGSGSSLWAQTVSSMTATDPSTVEFTLNAPWYRFPSMLSLGHGMIAAPAAYADGDSFTPIGAGPFTAKSFTPGEARVLEANPDYVDGAPPLDSVRLVALGGPQKNADAFRTGDLDIAYVRGQAPVIGKLIDDGYPGYMTILSSGSMEFVNNRDGHPGADVRVRKAIALAMDPDLVDQRFEGGEGLPTSELFGPESRWHPDTSGPAYDPDQARALLTQAEDDGYDGTLDYVYLNAGKDARIAQAVQSLLENVGFTVTMDPATSAADIITGVYGKHDYDIAHAGMGMYEAIPDLGLQHLYSESAGNTAGYADEEMDDLIARFRTAPGADAAVQVMDSIQQRWNETVPSAPVGALPLFWTWHKNVHGIVPSTTGIMLLGDAWVEQG